MAWRWRDKAAEVGVGRGGWQGRAGGKGAPVEEAYRVLYALADGAHFVAPGTAAR